MNKKSSSTPPAPKPPVANKQKGQGVSLLPLVPMLSIILSVVAIVGVLTYGLWGERLWQTVGRDTDIAATPHSHSDIEAQMATLRSDMNAQRAEAEERQAERTATRENINNSLATINDLLDSHDSDLQSLRDDYANLQSVVRQDPDILGNILSLIRLRQQQGESLGDIPELLQAAVGDVGALQTAIADLQFFSDAVIPSDYDLTTHYEAIQASLTVGGGNHFALTAERDFFKNLKDYIFSLVRVRKLSDPTQAPLTDNLTAAVQTGDFATAYELAKYRQGGGTAIDDWLVALRLRLQADRAIATLHTYHLATIKTRLQGDAQ